MMARWGGGGGGPVDRDRRAPAPQPRSTTGSVAETVVPTTSTATNPDFGRPGRRAGGPRPLRLVAGSVVGTTETATDSGVGASCGPADGGGQAPRAGRS